jgi:hypothetical protein
VSRPRRPTEEGGGAVVGPFAHACVLQRVGATPLNGRAVAPLALSPRWKPHSGMSSSPAAWVLPPAWCQKEH